MKLSEKNNRVYFRHFKKNCYIATFQKPRLKDTAIPTIDLPDRIIENIDENHENISILTLSTTIFNPTIELPVTSIEQNS